MTAPRPTVLLVDDEPHSLSAMRMALEDEFDCITAADADAALARMEEEWVQVVICDQRMPGRTGVEFLSDLRERWPDAVRILITGYTDPAAMAQAINDAGIQQFLTKPWHPEQLLVAVRNAARLFQLARENERLALEMRFWPPPPRPSWKSAAPPCARGAAMWPFWPSISWMIWPPGMASPPMALPPPRWSFWKTTTGPATCANCATR